MKYKALKFQLLTIAFITAIAFLNGTVAGWAQNIPSLFIVADSEMAARKIPMRLTDRINVNIDFSLIQPSPVSRAALRAPLPDREVVLLHNRIEKRGEDNYTWVGIVAGHELSTAVITVVKGIAVGYIDFDGETYSIEPNNNGYHVVKEDAARVLPFGNDVKLPTIYQEKKNTSVYPVKHVPEDGSRIDVLVLYTQKMANTYGAGLAAKIQGFVDLTNTAFTNSGIYTQIRLVKAELFTDVSAAEGVSIYDAVDYITGVANGYLVNPPPAAIQTLRDTYNADLVSLLRVHDGTATACGLGWIMSPDYINNKFAYFSFSVVGVKDAATTIEGQYFCDNRTFAHELGHNMGCDHDRAHQTSGATPAYSYSYGYGIDGIFGDVMSYIKPRITYFSTPLRTYYGNPIGVDEVYTTSADCVKTINNTRTTVANFRVATTQSGENICAASVSSSLVVHIPIVTYNSADYWADLQYNSSNGNLSIANAGSVANSSLYSGCTASTLTSWGLLHIPVVMISGVSYWFDLQYNGAVFVIKGYGQN